MSKINTSEKDRTTQNTVVLSSEGYILTKKGLNDVSGWRTETHKGWKLCECYLNDTEQQPWQPPQRDRDQAAFLIKSSVLYMYKMVP